MMDRGYGMFRGNGILGLIVVAIIIYFLVKVFTKNKSNSNTSIENDKAIELLRERYASGEISEEEYTSRLERLNK